MKSPEQFAAAGVAAQAAVIAAGSIPPGHTELKLLHESPLNRRKHFDEAKLKELAASIASKGIIEPIVIRVSRKEGAFEIVAGARRYRAAKMAKLAHVPTRLMDLDDQQTLEIMAIENHQREDVHALEEAELFADLLKGGGEGYTVELLAEKIGVEAGYVYRRMKLSALIESAKDAFQADAYPYSLAVEMSRLPVEAQELAMKTEALWTTRRHWDAARKEHVEAREPVTKAEFRAWIAEHVTMLLKDAPFPLNKPIAVFYQGAESIISCKECTNHTGAQSIIFDDETKKDDRCLDRKCFAAKRAGFIQIRTKEWMEAHDGAPMVAKGYQAPDVVKTLPKGTLTGYGSWGDKWTPANEKCKSQEEALIVGGDGKLGSTMLICRDVNCPKHGASIRGSHSKTKKTSSSGSSDRLAAKSAREREARIKSRQAILAAIVGKAEKTADTLVFVAAMAGRDVMDADEEKAVLDMLGWKPKAGAKKAKGAARDTNQLPTEREWFDMLWTLKPAERAQAAAMMIGSTFIHFQTWGNKTQVDLLSEWARLVKVDAAKIETNTKKQLAEAWALEDAAVKEKAKSDRKQPAAKKKAAKK